MNKATEIMLKWTISFNDGIIYQRGVEFSGEQIEESWLDDMREHGDEYDEEWFSLVATESIRETIDWDYIANELPKHIEYE
jgi:hypothetical protein